MRRAARTVAMRPSSNVSSMVVPTNLTEPIHLPSRELELAMSLTAALMNRTRWSNGTYHA